MKRFAIVLLAAFLAGFPPLVPETCAADKDEMSETVLIGFSLVVVSVLVILGIRSDREWRSAALDGEDVFLAGSDSPVTVRGDGVAFAW